jgi:hypothetical protein
VLDKADRLFGIIFAETQQASIRLREIFQAGVRRTPLEAINLWPASD